MCHGWMFDPDGDRAAADSTRSSTSLGTGWSVNPRTARRLVTASYTSMIAHLQSVSFLTVSYNTILFDTIPRLSGEYPNGWVDAIRTDERPSKRGILTA